MVTWATTRPTTALPVWFKISFLRRCNVRKVITRSGARSPKVTCDFEERGIPHFLSHVSKLSASHPWHSLPAALAPIALSAVLLAISAFQLPAYAGSLSPHETETSGSLSPADNQTRRNTASALEEDLLQAVKAVEAQLEDAVGSLGHELAEISGLGTSQSAASTASAHQLIQEVWQTVADNYLDAREAGFDRKAWQDMRDEALARSYRNTAEGYRVVKSMLSRALSDPYTRFLSPQEFAAMTKYDVTGIGLNLSTGEEFAKKTGMPLPPERADRLGGVWVMGLIRGSIAAEAGVAQGDELLALDGQAVDGQTPFQVASLIRGGAEAAAAGNGRQQQLSITVRKPDGGVREVVVTRPQTNVASPVNYKVDLRNGVKVGYVKLLSFNARAQADLKAALGALEVAGVQELVLDLRDNRGGLVSQGVEVAKLFLEEGRVVVVPEGRAMISDRPVTSASAPMTSAPLTLLVNEHTASASEILAGALHDNCRAVLVGERTYGKGLIQSVYELHDGSGLVLTVGKYKTPRGVDIDRAGIVPDFRRWPSRSSADAALGACRVQRGEAGVATM